jgi:hypothetical protein
MNRAFWLVLLSLCPLSGCALIDDWTACAEPGVGSPCGQPPAQVRACGDGQVIQASFPAQTAEPPRLIQAGFPVQTAEPPR